MAFKKRVILLPHFAQICICFYALQLLTAAVSVFKLNCCTFNRDINGKIPWVLQIFCIGRVTSGKR